MSSAPVLRWIDVAPCAQRNDRLLDDDAFYTHECRIDLDYLALRSRTALSGSVIVMVHPGPSLFAALTWPPMA